MPAWAWPLWLLGWVFGWAGFAGEAIGGGFREAASWSGVVLMGVRSVDALILDRVPKKYRSGLQRYLREVPPESLLRSPALPAKPEETVQIRRRRLQEQMVVLLGRSALTEAEAFVRAVPLSPEWEGMSEGPLAEAELARQWLDRFPQTHLGPFLYLFRAHRLRAAYEAARRENAQGLWPILAQEYQKELARALRSSNEQIVCIAEDLKAQPYVYLEGFGRP